MCAALGFVRVGEAQTDGTGRLRIGERLTYSISFYEMPNVAYYETQVVSKGKFKGREAIEIKSKLKTLNYATATSFLTDTERTALLSPTDGTTLVVKNTDKTAGLPVETLTNFSEKAVGAFDLSSIIYKIRYSGGSGTFTLYENEKSYDVTFNVVGNEVVRSDAGEFASVILDVKSNYLTELGFTAFRISVSGDESNIPVRFRAKTKRGEFDALIASIQVITEPTPSPTAVATQQTPRPTPRPTQTPAAYVDNLPLIGMPFELGETLEYAVMAGSRQVGTVVLAAKERKLVNERDSLLLSATVTNSTGELFRQNNGFRSYVDPDTLGPYDFSTRFDGPLSVYNQSVRFDPVASRVIIGANERIDVPIGTQNVLSLAYAMRGFNLEPSKNTANRVNDTRVAVYWQGKAHIFTLRPAVPSTITIGGQKLPAQQISISTGNQQLDALQIKVWLSEDEQRLPLRYSFGQYQLDLKLAAPTSEQ